MSKFLKEPVYHGKALEDQWVNSIHNNHDLFCGCHDVLTTGLLNAFATNFSSILSCNVNLRFLNGFEVGNNSTFIFPAIIL